jgi:hypothetical protein
VFATAAIPELPPEKEILYDHRLKPAARETKVAPTIATRSARPRRTAHDRLARHQQLQRRHREWLEAGSDNDQFAIDTRLNPEKYETEGTIQVPCAER